MNIWNILGIDATADRSAITAAYRARLSAANPEDHPEEFKQLRAAYEQALQLAKQAAAADGSTKSEAEQWSARINAIYQDIHRRSDPDQWKQLLAEDFCTRPANRTQARDCLLRYLAEHYLLPHTVWVVLEEQFSLRRNAEELRGLFPPAFIDNVVLPGIEFEDQLDFTLLDGGDGDACDDYIRACSQCLRATARNDMQSAQEFLTRMEATGVRHPYTLLCRARLAYRNQNYDTALADIRAILDQLPNDPQALLLDAQTHIRLQDYDQAEKLFRQVLAIAPDLAQARFDLASCLDMAGKLRESRKAFLDLLHDLPYNRTVYEALNQVNQKLLPELQKQYDEHPDDTDNAMELVWCLHQLQQTDKANDVLENLPADLAGRADYENLAAKIKLARREWKLALQHLHAWETALRQPDAADASRLPEAVRLQACARYSMGEKDKALAMLRQVTQTWPQDLDCWKVQAQFLFQESHLPEALDSIQHYRKAMPSDPSGAYMCGEILFRMRRLQESYNAFNDAMAQIGGKEATCLLYQCRILILAGQWEDAKTLLKQLSDAGIQEPALHYCQAQLAAHDNDLLTALNHYKALLPFCRADDSPDYAGEVFYRLVGLQYHTLPFPEKLQLVEEGLQHDPDSASLLQLKVDVLRDAERIPDALETCRKMCRLFPQHPTAFETLGRLLQFHCRDFAGAAQAYETQLKFRESPALHNLLGLCYQELERFADAQTQLLTAVNDAPKSAAFRGNLAEIYLIQGHLKEAEETFRHALTLPLPRTEDRVWLRRRLAITLRRAGRYAEAVSTLNPNIQQEYAYSDMCLQAQTWAQAGDPQRALETLRTWRKLAAPSEEAFWQEEAAVLQQMGRTKAALHDLRSGGDTDRDCRAHLGSLYLDLGRYRQAAEIFKSLCAQEPDRDHLWDRLTRSLFWLGDTKGAAEAAARGLACLEKDRSRYNKAMYYTRQASFLLFRGEYEKAAEALDKAEHAPLCNMCFCGTCKDAIGLRVLQLELTGHLEEAAALCRESIPRYPDETDFPVFYQRIRKKMERTS